MRQIGWILRCVILMGVVGCGGETDVDLSSDAQEALNRGWQAYGQTQFSAALLDFERAAKLDPKLADAHNGVGWSHLSLVDGVPSTQILDLATQAFNRALQADSAHADAWAGLGHVLFVRRKTVDDFEDAARALVSARNADAKTLFRHDYRTLADLHALEGWAHYYTGDMAAARAAAEAALDIQANTPSAQLLSNLAR